jgi:hypothetical protein
MSVHPCVIGNLKFYTVKNFWVVEICPNFFNSVIFLIFVITFVLVEVLY